MEFIPPTETKKIQKSLEIVEADGHSRVLGDWVTIMLCALNSPPREAEYWTLAKKECEVIENE